MRPFVALCMCIFTFLVQAWAQLANEREIEQITKCKAENKASEDVMQVLDGFVPESLEGKCMLACFLEANELMKEGKLYRAGMETWLKKEFAALLDVELVTEAVYNECVAPYIEIERCEAASSFIGCGVKARLLIKAWWQQSDILWSDDEKH